MVKKLTSVLLIILLIVTTTILPFGLNSSCFVYADEEETFTDLQKQNLAVGTYVNSRNGWYKGTSPGAVIGIIARDINNFYTSNQNDTSIKSTEQFAEHIIITTDPLKVRIDSTGISFLNDLLYYIFGGGNHPDIYNGTWGNGDKWDNLFNGYAIGNNLIYFYNTNISISEGQTKTLLLSDITQYGTPIDLNGNDFYHLVTSKYAIESWEYSDKQDMIAFRTYRYPETGEFSVRFHRNFEYNYYVQGKMEFNDHRYPKIVLSSGSTSYINDVFYSNTGTVHQIGYFVNLMIFGRNNNLYSGFLTFQTGSNNVNFHCLHVSTTTEADVIQGSADFAIKDFDKEDPEGDVEYTPQYTTDNGNTYNNFTGGDTYNNYYNYEYQGDTKIIKNYYNNNQTGGTTPPWNSDNSGTANPDGNGGFNLNLPDLTIPDLDFDWNINGLQQKFPFSIPWDLVAFFTVLNATPETPEIQEQIDLGIVNWDIDWNLHDFDNLAALLRNLEFIGFCLALILITRSIIKG